MPSELTPALNVLGTKFSSFMHIHVSETNGITSAKLVLKLDEEGTKLVKQIVGLYNNSPAIAVKNLDDVVFITAPAVFLKALVEDLYANKVGNIFYSQETYLSSVGQTLLTDELITSVDLMLAA